MEIEILEQTKNKVEFEIKDEDATVCNALIDALWQFEETEVAAFSKDHPLVKKVKMIVSVKKGNPINTIIKACEKVKTSTKALKTELSKKL